MKVSQITTCDEGLTNPKRSANGITFALRWGDVCDPYLDPDGWFGPEKPAFVLRFWLASFVPVLLLNVWALLIGTAVMLWSPWAAFFLLTLPLVPGVWLTWNLWGWRGYAGWKCYGVDSEQYLSFVEPANVYPESTALCLTARFRITD